MTRVRVAVDDVCACCPQARVVAYDTARPNVRTTATADITVLRNPNAPEWLAPGYAATIRETAIVGSTVLNTTAIDRDVTVSQLGPSQFPLTAAQLPPAPPPLPHPITTTSLTTTPYHHPLTTTSLTTTPYHHHPFRLTTPTTLPPLPP